MDTPFTIAGLTFRSRLIVGTGKYPSFEVMKKCHDASGTELGTASDAAIAMELGCDAILMNTAIAGAKDPVRMAHAMRKAVEAGRDAFLAGRVPRKGPGA